MSLGYQLSVTAQRYVDEIGAFIAQDSVAAALDVYDALEHAFELLASQPGIGHKREDLTDRPLRFLSVHAYLVVYDPASRPLTIVAVLHGARDTQRLLKTIVPSRPVPRPPYSIMTFDERVTAALELEPAARMRLAQRLLASLNTSPLDENARAWAEEAQRCGNALAAGTLSSRPAENVSATRSPRL